MNKITNQIKLMGGMLSFIIFSIVLITIYINYVSQQDSMVVNVAGKQRMLTQKMTKEIFGLQHGQHHDFKSLNASISEFEASLQDLIEGNPSRNIYQPPKVSILEQLLLVQSQWHDFHSHLNYFEKLLNDTQELKREMPRELANLLDLSEQVVKQMVRLGLTGNAIDLAGRQRMLTQKNALQATQYIITQEEKYLDTFTQAANLYDTTLQHFLDDPRLQDHAALYALLQKNQATWKHYMGFMEKLLRRQQELNKTISNIRNTNVTLLTNMDTAVNAYSAFSKEQRQLLQYVQYAAIFFALLAILYAVHVIWKIETLFNSFLKLSGMMVGNTALSSLQNSHNELSLIWIHLNRFMERIHSVMQLAQQAIHTLQTTQASEPSKDFDLDDVSKQDENEAIIAKATEALISTSKQLDDLQNILDKIISDTETET